MESLKIDKIIVVLNKIDLFTGNLNDELGKIRDFFGSTSFGFNVPIYSISAKNESGFEELKMGILKTVKK